MKYIEYRVITECSRNFVWAAIDMESLFLQLHDRGYKATFVQENSEYERAVVA